MLSFIKNIFKQDDHSSRRQANDRLRVVLAHDRAGTSSELMETIQEEIIQVIAKHMDIAGKPEVNFIREGRHSALDISIPIKGR
ncbi:MAG: cell division topological specificity factor MinE [Syntrophomonadaceae bacterium]|nr:cell division topological specificity factor MinE [Syntrophomonadaceae bacterium]